jgi:hypothetical protein
MMIPHQTTPQPVRIGKTDDNQYRSAGESLQCFIYRTNHTDTYRLIRT